MTELQTPNAILFLDFDGTITRRDAVDVILEAYADPEWLRFELEWREGRLGSRDCLRAQMGLVRASRGQLDTLLDEIEIDEGLIPLLEMCAAHNIPAHIISDGFDYCIGRILGRPDAPARGGVEGNLLARLNGSHVVSSRLRPDGWQVSAQPR